MEDRLSSPVSRSVHPHSSSNDEPQCTTDSNNDGDDSFYSHNSVYKVVFTNEGNIPNEEDALRETIKDKINKHNKMKWLKK